MNKLTIYGARGSCSVSGGAFRRYGGHTSCIAVESKQGILVLDAGSGLTGLAQELDKRSRLLPITILFTHFHLDHVIGLPSFWPFYEKGAQITLMADSKQFPQWKNHLMELFAAPYWPAHPLKGPARVTLASFSGSGDRATRIHGIEIYRHPILHPQGGTSYKLIVSGKSAVLATDRERGSHSQERRLTEFFKKTDWLIHDAQYTPAEYSRRRGWGHSTWKVATDMAENAGAKKLLLTSHDPSRTDAQIDAIVRQARRIFPRTEAAHEGMHFSLGD